jgi:hypothetical protein
MVVDTAFLLGQGVPWIDALQMWDAVSRRLIALLPTWRPGGTERFDGCHGDPSEGITTFKAAP